MMKIWHLFATVATLVCSYFIVARNYLIFWIFLWVITQTFFSIELFRGIRK